MRYTYRYRSFFWPALLILAGLVALLVNTGQIPAERLEELINLWPLILIVIGLELVLRRTVHGVAGDVAAALIVILAVVGAAAYVAVAPSPSATHTIDASEQVGGLTEARAEIDAGAATITIDGGAESQLFQAHIDYAGPKPDVRVDRSEGRLVISQRSSFPFFQSRKFTMRLSLNPTVAWALEINTGASTTTLNLGQAHVTSLQLNTGASKDDITLGPASTSVPVQVNGGALTVNIHRPSDVGTTIDVSGGAVTLNADGHSFHAVGHTTYQSTAEGPGLYRIEVNGGACTVTLDKTGGA